MSRIAISVQRDGEGLKALLDDRFGRAEAFVVVDGETREVIETIDNASADASHGAGPAAAAELSSAGVNAVISGHFGPKAFDALRALGIETWTAPSGSIAEDALGMLDEGRLELVQS